MTDCENNDLHLIEQRYRALANGPDGIVSRYDATDLKLHFVSPAYCTLFSQDEADLVGVSILDLVDTAEGRQAITNRLSSIDAANPTVRGQNTIVTGDGVRRNVLWTTTGIFEKSGRLVEYQSVGRDVTDLQQAAQDIAKSHMHYVQAAKIAGVGFWVWDEIEDRLVFCTEEAAAIYGVTVSEALARSYSLEANASSTHPDDRDRYIRVMEEAARENKSYDITVRTIRADGAVRHIRHLGEPIHDADGRLIQTVGTVQDITKEREAREALALARHAADAANRAKSEFLASVSHELRTPLNAVLGFSELMAMEAHGAIGNPKYTEYAESIRTSGEHLLSLINDILDLSKVEAGQFELVLEDLPLAASVSECLDMVRFRFGREAERLSIRISLDTPTVCADPRVFRQIIVNLLSNADKFTPADGSITIASEPAAGGGVAVTVSDTGIGIAEKDMERVMEPFGQTAVNTTTFQKGTGLGLPLSKKLIELHGGTLAISSREGHGTSVRVTFPPPRPAA